MCHVPEQCEGPEGWPVTTVDAREPAVHGGLVLVGVRAGEGVCPACAGRRRCAQLCAGGSSLRGSPARGQGSLPQRCPSQRGAQHWKLPSQMQYLFSLEAGSHMPKLAKCPQVTALSCALSCSPTPAALPHLQQVAHAGWDPVPHTRRVLCPLQPGPT